MILRDILIKAAREAGKIHKNILKDNSPELENKYDGNSERDKVLGAVTKADKKSEQWLRNYFAGELPDFNVFGEEFGGEYDGNGKVIFIDPLDGTKAFKEIKQGEKLHGRDTFGPMIGIYQNGLNIGGVVYNVLRDIMYVATEETGFERIGPEESIPKNTIVIRNLLKNSPDFCNRVEELIKKEFPGHPMIKQNPEVTDFARVCDGEWSACFYSNLARHDIAALPIFGKTTGTLITNHLGEPYEKVYPKEELKRYNTEDKDQIYVYHTLAAKPEFQHGMLRVLSHFRNELEQ